MGAPLALFSADLPLLFCFFASSVSAKYCYFVSIPRFAIVGGTCGHGDSPSARPASFHRPFLCGDTNIYTKFVLMPLSITQRSGQKHLSHSTGAASSKSPRILSFVCVCVFAGEE